MNFIWFINEKKFFIIHLKNKIKQKYRARDPGQSHFLN